VAWGIEGRGQGEDVGVEGGEGFLGLGGHCSDFAMGMGR